MYQARRLCGFYGSTSVFNKDGKVLKEHANFNGGLLTLLAYIRHLHMYLQGTFVHKSNYVTAYLFINRKMQVCTLNSVVVLTKFAAKNLSSKSLNDTSILKSKIKSD